MPEVSALEYFDGLCLHHSLYASLQIGDRQHEHWRCESLPGDIQNCAGVTAYFYEFKRLPYDYFAV
jgi:hypothetical protein